MGDDIKEMALQNMIMKKVSTRKSARGLLVGFCDMIRYETSTSPGQAPPRLASHAGVF